MCDKTGAQKIQVAVGRCPGTDLRNVFIEGDVESVEKCKDMIQEIVD